MPRKSPRARKKPDPPRIRGTGRPRAKPGRGRSSAARSIARAAQSAHAPKGARPASKHTRAGTRPRAARPRAARPRAVPRPPKLRAARPRSRPTPPDPARVADLIERLERAFPAPATALDFHDPLQLLIATILSAQCTDARVNMVTPALFAKYPDARAFAAAPQADVEALIRSTGFFRNKARSIRECCGDIVARHGGEVPRTLEALTALRGVGRKTANVVLGNAYGIPGLVVDTHVARLSNRLGLTRETDPVKIEFALMPIVPRERWTAFSHWLILHGRATCIARKPRCSACSLATCCPRVGVTASQ
jgi:endonuclease-3